ncbi:MAG: ABC transporter substrate binding protein, partial [bacterium]
MKKYYTVILLVLVAFLNLKAKNDSPIFVLNSYHPEFKWTSNEVAGIKNVLLSRKYTGNLYIEYLDSKNFAYSKMATMYYELIKQKYKEFKFKVVICTDKDALFFLQKYGEELFPEANFVFCGINGPLDLLNVNREKFTGVITNMEYEDNIKTILNIMPETKEIVTFFDSTETGKVIYPEYIKSTKKFENIGVKFTCILNPSINQLTAKLSKLKKGQVILQGELSKDKDGIVYNYSNIATIITRISRVPVFGNQIDMLRKGIIGGKFINPFEQGRAACILALQILKGKSTKDLKVVNNLFGKYFFDNLILEKFDIDLVLLPKDSKIIIFPVTYWEKNQELLIKVGIGFLVLLILIFILLLNIIARKKAENQLLKSKGEIDKILASITDCVWSVDFDKENKVKSFYFSPVI